MRFPSPQCAFGWRTGAAATVGFLLLTLATTRPASAESLRLGSGALLPAGQAVRGRLVAKQRSKIRDGGTPEEKHACAAAYTQAEEKAKAAHLREAKDLLSKCARATCGTFLHQECTTLYTQLDADVPSVVPLVTDDSGLPHDVVEVRMDGELLTSQLDGHALQVDPGKHEFSFSSGGTVFSVQKVMIVQGQRNRPIAVKLHTGKKKADASDGEAVAVAPEGDAGSGGEATQEEEGATGASASAGSSGGGSATSASSAASTEGASAPRVRTITRTRAVSAKTPMLSYVFAGTGVAALGGAALLTYWGRKDNTSLDNSCTPNCTHSSVDHVRKLYLAADIAAGVGVASLIASTWLYVRAHTTAIEEIPVPSTATSAPKARPKKAALTALSFDLLPAPSGGAFATVGGTF